MFLDGLGDAGLDDHPLLDGGPVGLDGRPLEVEPDEALGLVVAVDDDLDHVPRVGQGVLAELLGGDDALALAAEVDEDVLAADPDDPAHPRPRAPLLAPLLAGDVPRLLTWGTGAFDGGTTR